MKEGYISIIIDCNNIKSIRCIDSILNESFKNYEILLLNNNNREYEKKNKCIRSINNINEAKYKYISFINPNDYIEENYHEELLKSIKKNNSDISVCDIYMKYEGDVYKEDSRRKVGTDKASIITSEFSFYPYNKLFKKELVKDSIIESLINASNISYTDKTFYNAIGGVQEEKDINTIFDSVYSLIEKENTKDYLDSIIYNQVILYFINNILLEKKFINRYKSLRVFHKRSKNLNILNNTYYQSFLNNQPKVSRLFYKYIFLFNKLGLNIISNVLTSIINSYKNYSNRNVIKKDITLNDLIKCAKKQSKKKSIVNLTAVIPNYNYEKFLYQRIYSILNQTEKISELIILDDCSKDNSRELIDNIYNELKDIINIKKVYNETNSGSAFKQWKKAFDLAEGDYVWIAEADDYCLKDFLKSVLKPLGNDKDIVISYCDTAMINAIGNIIMKSVVPEIDVLKTNHWNTNYVNDGLNEINNYTYLNCTISNVSSVVFKKNDYSEYLKISGEYKQAGDWLFYINVMTNGKIAFSNKTLNFYRLHGNNQTSVTKKESHLEEMNKLYSYIDKKFKLNKNQKNEIEKRINYLIKEWNLKW